MKVPTNSEIIRHLNSKTLRTGFLDRLKIRYRPLICPFGPLLEVSAGKRSAFDIGCGSGQFCALLANFTEVSKIKGIEINDRLVSNAQEVVEDFRNQKVLEFMKFDGKTIPDDIAEYELVYMIDVFHHIPLGVREDFLAELHRKMRVGATLIFKDIDADSPLLIFNRIHDLILGGGRGNEISLDDATSMLNSAGFRVIQTRKQTVLVYPHYLVICEKRAPN